MSYYNKCPVCGANLDPGEACNCEEQRSFEKTSKDKPKAWRCDCENEIAVEIKKAPAKVRVSTGANVRKDKTITISLYYDN